jgi:hemerythrin-like domain-containing protein
MTQRYNIFNQLHKGLEALLYDTAIMIQQTSFCQPAEGKITLEKINRLLYLFSEHAALEDRYLLPVLRPFDEFSIRTLEKDHQAGRLLLTRLKGLMQTYEQAVSGEEKIQLGKTIGLAFRELLVGALKHMSLEEEILNSILWARFSDREIFAMEQNIISHIPQDDITMYSLWMIRGMNNHEIIAWLKTIEKTAAGPVFQVLFSLAENELSSIRWQKIQEGLTEGAMVA